MLHMGCFSDIIVIKAFLPDQVCVHVFQKTHLTIDEGPSSGDFVVASDPVVDGLGWLAQVDLQGAE